MALPPTPSNKNYPPLPPSTTAVHPSAKESATVEKLQEVVSKLQNLASSSTKERAYQIERNLMAQKIKDLLEDLSIQNQNCDQYHKAIKLLGAKVKNLKIQNENLLHQNNILTQQSSTAQHLELELQKEKKITWNLLQKISSLKTKVTGFYQEQSQSDQENLRIMIELREENTNYKNLLGKIVNFRDNANLDSLSLSEEFKILNDDYRNFFHF